MKIIALTTLTLTLLAVGLVSAEPKLDIDYKQYDFGWVPHNSTGVRYFTIRSIGEDTLTLTGIYSSCKCLELVPETMSIPPGDTLVVPVVWQFDDTPNRTTQYTRIFTNEEESINGKPLLVKFEAMIVANPETMKPVAAKPYRVEFSRMAKVNIDSVQFTLTNDSERELELAVTAYPYKDCEISVPDSLRPYSVDTCWIKLKPGTEEREFISSMTIRMTDKLNYDRSLTLPVRRKSYSQ